jgi:uncharacterized protein HemX
MKQRPQTMAHTATAPVMASDDEQSTQLLRSAEWGRKAILAGWVAATLGIVGYVYVLIQAGEQTAVLDALRNAGLIGFASALLLAGGVAIWLAGNIALMRAMVDTEPNDDKPQQY